MSADTTDKFVLADDGLESMCVSVPDRADDLDPSVRGSVMPIYENQSAVRDLV